MSIPTDLIRRKSDTIQNVTHPLNTDDLEKKFKEEIKSFVFSYENLENDLEITTLENLAHMFGFRVTHTDTEDVTHLVVKTHTDDCFRRTSKTGSALVAHLPIINYKWVLDCLEKKSFLPEHGYMPVDISNEPSPLSSWRVGKGIIQSRMDWTSNCILYFHNTVLNNHLYPKMINWARKLGFTVTNDFEDFKRQEFKLRLILIDLRVPNRRAHMINRRTMSIWMNDYNAVSVKIEWFIECLFQYKFMKIKTMSTPIPMTFDTADKLGILEYFEFV